MSFPDTSPGHLPLQDQITLLRTILATNQTLMTVLSRASALNAPNWYLAAGAISQTIWNYMSGLPSDTGISDYDIVYHDASDLSWEAEDAVIQAGRELFADVSAEVEIRNQARVHLWYGQKHGCECKPHQSTEAGICTWITNSAMVGVRTRTGAADDASSSISGRDHAAAEYLEWDVYAPWGLTDLFDLVVRPNPVLGSKEAYEKKTQRWKAIWTKLRIVPWPEQ